jgi:hypothetical protein
MAYPRWSCTGLPPDKPEDRILYEVIRGTESVEPLRQVILQRPSVEALRVPDRAREYPDALRVEAERRRLLDAKPLYASGEPHDRQKNSPPVEKPMGRISVPRRP